MEELARQAQELNLGMSEAFAFHGRLSYMRLPSTDRSANIGWWRGEIRPSAADHTFPRKRTIMMILDIRYKLLIYNYK
jgi:hypothetical protein